MEHQVEQSVEQSNVEADFDAAQGERTPLVQVGPTAISIEVVHGAPWNIGVDAFTLPTGDQGEFGGRLAESFREAIGDQWSRFTKFAGSSIGEHGLPTPGAPQRIEVAELRELGIPSTVFLATSIDGTRTAENAGQAAVAVARLAAQNKVRSLMLPLLGAGAGGLPPEKVVVHMLQALFDGGPYPGVRDIVITTLDVDDRDVAIEWARAAQDATQRASLAGYATEGWREDHPPLLGIMPDVEAMASIIASTEINPPLSIGLFGQWGVGKTFFMKQLQKQIERRCTAARAEMARRADAGETGAELRYHKDVVPVWFNAWHYVDANLWASIVTNVFDTLAHYQNASNPDAARERLLEELDLAKDDLARAKQKLADASQALTTAQDHLTEIEAEQLAASDQLNATDVATLVSEDAVVQDGVERARKAIRAEEFAQTGAALLEVKQRAEQVLDEARQFGGYVSAVFRGVFPGIKRKTTLAIVGTAGILAVGLVVSAVYYEQVLAWVSALPIAGALAWVRAKASDAKALATDLHNGLRGANERISQIRSQRSQQELEARATIDRLRDERRATENHVLELGDRARKAQHAYDDAAAGRMLSRFIQQRSESSDYRKSLGIIGSIHEDFKKLETLLVDSTNRRETENTSEDDTELVHIDRIVLYIDDLDRCPPNRVVEVIQAVHLLLALKLFVVVVAVDPRWVKRALGRHPDLLLNDAELGTRDVSIANELSLRVTGLPMPDETGPEHRATPQNYLEKIFQIPYTLGFLTDEGYDELVEHLTEVTPELPAASNGNGKTAPAPTPMNAAEATLQAETDAPEVSESKSNGAVTEPRESTTQDVELLTPERVVLEPAERAFLRSLSPCIRTPRAAKRLINSYRLVRATLTPRERKEFLADAPEAGYKAAAILLAIATGMPRVGRDLYKAVRETAEKRIERVCEGNGLEATFAALARAQPIPVQVATYRAWEHRVRRYAFYL